MRERNDFFIVLFFVVVGNAMMIKNEWDFICTICWHRSRLVNLFDERSDNRRMMKKNDLLWRLNNSIDNFFLFKQRNQEEK